MKCADYSVLPENNKSSIYSLTKFCLLAMLMVSVFAGQASARKPRTTRYLRTMARLCVSTDNLTKAQQLTEKALDIASSTGTNDHEKSLCLTDLAYVYSKQNKLEKALDYYLRGLRLQKNILGDEDVAVAYTLKNIASTQRRQKKYIQAQHNINQGINILKANNVPPHGIATFQVELARIYGDQNRLEESENLYNTAFEIIKNSYGPSHLYTAKVMTDFAKLLVNQKKYGRAHDLATKALNIQQQVYKKNHHNMIPAWITLSEILKHKNNIASARSLLDKSLAIAEERKLNNPALRTKVLKAITTLYTNTSTLELASSGN